MRALHHRVARLEVEAERRTTPSVGAMIAAILDGKGPRAPIPDEELARTAAGRLLLARRQRAEANYPGLG
jgi:hypothetical protein